MKAVPISTVEAVHSSVDGSDSPRPSDGDALRPEVAGRDRLIWPALSATLDQIARSRSPQWPSVLDCGGGSGSLAVPLAVVGARVVVLDISVDALATLGRRADEAGVADRVEGVQGDIEDLGVRSLGEHLPARPQVDLLLAHGVLAGAEDPLAVLGRMIAAIVPGGALSVVIANPVAAVLARAISGDVVGALGELARHAPGTSEGDEPVPAVLDAAAIARVCAAEGLVIEITQGIDVLADLVPGAILESTPGAVAALARFEQAAARVEPYRSIASRLHLIARRPG